MNYTEQFKEDFNGKTLAERCRLHSDIGEQLAQVSGIPHPVATVKWVHISQVIANNYNPNKVATPEMKLLHTSIKNDGYCVEAGTPILCADLIWRPAGELQQGDELIAFDENPSGEQGRRKHRHFKTGVVLSNAIQKSDLLQVVTDKGTVLCNPPHPWLAKKSNLKWVEAQHLRKGDIVYHLIDTWKPDDSHTAGWLAGFLDGEGYVDMSRRNLRVVACQAVGPTCDRMVEAMRSYACCFVSERAAHKPGWQNMIRCRTSGLNNTAKLLGTVRPKRLLENAGKFWEGKVILSSNAPSICNNGNTNKARVLAVEKAGCGNIALLSTSTRTYIANGFAMHNTQPTVAAWDDAQQKYVIIDGFHRYSIMRMCPDISELTDGYLPIVVLNKSLADRMASTVRHNRARGTHSVQGMSNMVFKMLSEGKSDVDVCNELGLEAEELARLKYISGYARLFKDIDYSRAWAFNTPPSNDMTDQQQKDRLKSCEDDINELGGFERDAED